MPAASLVSKTHTLELHFLGLNVALFRFPLKNANIGKTKGPLRIWIWPQFPLFFPMSCVPSPVDYLLLPEPGRAGLCLHLNCP